MITLTENAKEKLETLMGEQSTPTMKIRLFVTGGGCSGFNYGFTFEEQKEDGDFEYGNLLVDSMSMQYLDGCEVDYQDDGLTSQFVIKNPNATATCGCGKSFAA